MSPVLQISNLHVGFRGRAGITQVLRDVSLKVEPGEIVGLAGESGSGKSTTPLAGLGLLPPNAVVTGQAVFQGQAVMDLAQPSQVRQELRGNASLIFQQPMKAFSPYYTFGRQLTDAIAAQTGCSRLEATTTALEALADVQMPDPQLAMKKYPHQVSGGQAQRMMIALALSCNPKLLVADEPTTALDVTVQAQVIHLIRDLAKSRGIGVLFITHDLGVIAELCDRVYVLYGGRMCENADVSAFFHRPRHCYSAALLRSMPVLGATNAFETIPGNAPSPDAMPPGCAFHPRCTHATDKCTTQTPDMPISAGSGFACWHPVNEPAEAIR